MDILFILSVAVWYHLIVWDRAQRIYWGRLEVASTLNAVIISIGGVLIAIKHYYGYDISIDIHILRFIPVGYYLVDCIYTTPIFILHHIAVFALVLLAPATPSLSIAVFLMEIPIGPLNIVLWMRSYTPSIQIGGLEIFVISTFFVTRVVLFPIALLWNLGVIVGHQAALLLVPVFACITTLNLYWFAKLIM